MNLLDKIKDFFRYKSTYDNDVDFEFDGPPIIYFEPKFISQDKVNSILDKKIKNFFPKDGKWYSSCYAQPSEFEMDNLPCHLRNSEWLAQMLRYQQNIYDINFEQILEYVINSSFFAEQRQEYEEKIVKWQINYMINGGEGWLVDPAYGGDFSSMKDKCEKQFRQGVIKTLTAIGLDRETIEICLEKYSNIWLNKMINTSFNNTFEYTHSFPTIDDNTVNLNSYEMPKADPLFREAWIKLKRYYYYQEHKQYVNMINGMNDVANLTEEEISKIKKYVELNSHLRQQAIITFKNYMSACDKSNLETLDNPLGNMYIDKKESVLCKNLKH